MKSSLFTSIVAFTDSLIAGSAKVARNLLTMRSYTFCDFGFKLLGVIPVGNIAGCASSVFLPSFGFNDFLRSLLINSV